MSDLRELVDKLEKEAQNVEDMPDSNLGEGYKNGVCSGIRYVKDELEEWLDENEERTNARVHEPYGARNGNSYGVDE